MTQRNPSESFAGRSTGSHSIAGCDPKTQKKEKEEGEGEGEEERMEEKKEKSKGKKEKVSIKSCIFFNLFWAYSTFESCRGYKGALV